MAYNFSPFKKSAIDAEDWLRREFAGIRTGRATPSIFDGVKVEAYGSQMSITELANISIEDARMIRITPWDMSIAKSIEKSIITSDLGLSVTLDDKGLRVVFPDLTSERRTAFIKMAKQKLEDAKVTLRGEREKVLKDIDKQEKDGKMSEDEKFRTKTELQKILDEAMRALDEMFTKKDKEISE